MKQSTHLLQWAFVPFVVSQDASLPWWIILARVFALVGVFGVLFSMAAEHGKNTRSFRWVVMVFTILLPANVFWWVAIPLAVFLTFDFFWWETVVRKIIWDPFWWVILFLIILWVPFLRVWWWFFLPLMLLDQLRTLYLWWIDWDYDYAKQKWVFLEIIPLQEMLMPLKVMEDVFSAIWPIMDVGNFRERWCDGELANGPYWCSWEIASIEGKIHYYLRFLQQHRNSIESALFGHYPDIEIHEASDYVHLVPPTIPNTEWDMYGEDWDLVKPDAYPIKTYESFFEPQGEKISAEEKRMDPIISLLEAMGRLGPGEHYWVQFTTVPVCDYDEPEWKKEGQKIVNKIAKRPDKGKEPTFFEELVYVGRQLFAGPEKEGSGDKAKYSWAPLEEDEETGELKISLTPGEREIITAIEDKLKKPVFRTNIRGVYVAKREAWRAPNRTLMRSYMGHFLTVHMNEFRFQGKTRPRVHFFMRKRRVFMRARKMFRMTVLRFPPLFPDRMSDDLCPILSSEELATLYHFPVKVSGMVTPTLGKIESKRAGPPANLPVDE